MIGKGAVKPWLWMIIAVVAPALPLLLDVPWALVSLSDSPTRAGATTWTSTAVTLAVPDPLTQLFDRVTSSGLPILVPAVAFLVPVRYRRRALLAAGAVLGVLIAVALAVTQTAGTGDAVEAGVLAACYAGSIAASVRAYRLTAAEEPA